MFKYFIDCANVEYNEMKLGLINPFSEKTNFSGITTNPGIVSKENINSLKEYGDRVKLLCEQVSKHRQDNNGVVYVQILSDDMEVCEVFKFAHMIEKWSDGNTKIGLKIPPYKKYLTIVKELINFMEINVTGISEVGTALRVAQYPIRYLSIIPGRMEEASLNAQEHVKYVSSARTKDCSWEIITGAMRTLEQLQWCIEYNTVPTIGKRVLDLVNDTNVSEVFSWEPKNFECFPFAPETTTQYTKLSLDFFEEMNQKAIPILNNFQQWMLENNG